MTFKDGANGQEGWFARSHMVTSIEVLGFRENWMDIQGALQDIRSLEIKVSFNIASYCSGDGIRI